MFHPLPLFQENPIQAKASQSLTNSAMLLATKSAGMTLARAEAEKNINIVMENNMSFEHLEHLPEFPPDLFKRHDVVALAENAHGQHDQTILRFLDQFCNQLNAIFIELPINYQQSIDRYLADGQIDEALEQLFVGAEKEGKNIRGLLEILDKIKNAQKPVICFDSAKTPEGDYQTPSRYGRYFLKGKSRDDDMFTSLSAHLSANPGKYLLIGGANHFMLGEHPQSGDTTLGQKLSDALGERFDCLTMD